MIFLNKIRQIPAKYSIRRTSALGTWFKTLSPHQKMQYAIYCESHTSPYLCILEGQAYIQMGQEFMGEAFSAFQRAKEMTRHSQHFRHRVWSIQATLHMDQIHMSALHHKCPPAVFISLFEEDV